MGPAAAAAVRQAGGREGGFSVAGVGVVVQGWVGRFRLFSCFVVVERSYCGVEARNNATEYTCQTLETHTGVPK